MSEPESVAEAPAEAPKKQDGKNGCLGCLAMLVGLVVLVGMCAPDKEDTPASGAPQAVATAPAAGAAAERPRGGGLGIDQAAFIAGWNSESDSKLSKIEFEDGIAQITLQNEQVLQLWANENGTIKEAMILFASNEIMDRTHFIINIGAMVAATQPNYTRSQRSYVFDGLRLTGEDADADITDETKPRTFVLGWTEYSHSYIQGTAFTFIASLADTPTPVPAEDPADVHGLGVDPNTFISGWNELSEQKLSDVAFEDWGVKIDLGEAQLLYLNTNGRGGGIKEANVLLTMPASETDVLHFINNSGALVTAVEPDFTSEQVTAVLVALKMLGEDMDLEIVGKPPRTHVVGRTEFSFSFVEGLGYFFGAELAK